MIKMRKLLLLIILISLIAVAIVINFVVFANVNLYFIDIPNGTIFPQTVKLFNPKISLRLSTQHAIRYLNSPYGKSKVNVLPKNTKLKGIRVNNSTVIADFDEEFLNAEHWSGSDIAYLRLQALAYSLTSICGAKRLKILVNGKTPPPLGGHEDVSKPIELDQSLLRR
ncbi:MAG: hypothetical protein RUDDFDWM_001396 [Candidatus Fervidibacterota bacterium]